MQTFFEKSIRLRIQNIKICPEQKGLEIQNYKMKVLVTCPPMLKQIEQFRSIFDQKNIELVTPNVVQTLTEEELMELLPEMDGWIIGDDPATERVFTEGKKGNLKAAVKWGVGVDNVDFEACKKLDIPIINTPNMFGAEVAGIAVNYVIGLARQTYVIDRGVRAGKMVKTCRYFTFGKNGCVNWFRGYR